MSRGLKVGLIAGGIVLVLLMVLPPVLGAVFGGYGGWARGGWSMMGPGMMGGFGFFPFMVLGPVVFWGLVIWGIVVLVRHYSRTSVSAGSALEILKQRYAKGEISKEEFDARKKDLA
jgi:putative membrane protein